MLHHQPKFVHDQNGNRTDVIIPIQDYEALIDELLDARDVLRLPELREGIEEGERITIEEFAKQYGIEL